MLMSGRPTRAVPAAIQEHNWNLKTGVENESVVNAFRRICERGRWQWRSSTAYSCLLKWLLFRAFQALSCAPHLYILRTPSKTSHRKCTTFAPKTRRLEQTKRIKNISWG